MESVVEKFMSVLHPLEYLEEHRAVPPIVLPDLDTAEGLMDLVVLEEIQHLVFLEWMYSLLRVEAMSIISTLAGEAGQAANPWVGDVALDESASLESPCGGFPGLDPHSIAPRAARQNGGSIRRTQ